MTIKEMINELSILSDRVDSGDLFVEVSSSTGEALKGAVKSFESWELLIEEINEVDFDSIVKRGYWGAEILKTALLNSIEKYLKEVEE